MPHIIRDAEFKDHEGNGLWPGMWVHNYLWKLPRRAPTPLDACFLWRVEQHDGVMVLAGQGVDVVVPLSEEILNHYCLFKHPQETSLAEYPEEWAALRKLGWGIHLCYGNYQYRNWIKLDCHRGYQHEVFWLSERLQYQLHENPEIMRSFLRAAWWRLKHPKYADALARQQPEDFWDWPNTPAPRVLHQLGIAAYRTEVGRIEISPDGQLKATGRKRWGLPLDEESE